MLCKLACSALLRSVVVPVLLCRFVTKELISRGFNVTALAREKAGIKGKMSKDDTIKVCCWESRRGVPAAEQRRLDSTWHIQWQLCCSRASSGLVCRAPDCSTVQHPHANSANYKPAIAASSPAHFGTETPLLRQCCAL